MASFNKVFLMGNLTRDPEMRFTQSGQAVASFGMAANSKYKSGDDWKEKVCFIDIAVWGKSGENCAEYLKKGSPVLIEGELEFDQWEKDGAKQSRHKVTARNVQFLNKKGDAQKGDNNDIPF